MEIRFAPTHEWYRPENPAEGFIGITAFAAASLGDITFIDLPPVGFKLNAGEGMGSIESVKAASDLYAPVTGTVLEVNTALESSPELINADPLGQGWMLRIALDDTGAIPATLLAEPAYRELCQKG